MFIFEVAKAFNKAKIAYAVVGGYAVALHGAVRGTVDVDIVLSLKPKNFIDCEAVLHGLGLVSRLPISAKDVVNFRQEFINKRNLIAWNFYSPEDPTKIVDIIITHDLDEMTFVKKKFTGVTVAIIGIDDLIKMKKQAGRPQDLHDVAALERIKK